MLRSVLQAMDHGSFDEATSACIHERRLEVPPGFEPHGLQYLAVSMGSRAAAPGAAGVGGTATCRWDFARPAGTTARVTIHSARKESGGVNGWRSVVQPSPLLLATRKDPAERNAMTRFRRLAIAALAASTVAFATLAAPGPASAMPMSCATRYQLSRAYYATAQIFYALGDYTAAFYWAGKSYGIIEGC